MTKEQENLVIENHNLIYYFIHKYNLSIEDYYDVCAIGLCKAAGTYDSKKGVKFSTYASFIMENEIRMEFRKVRMRKRLNVISLNESMCDEFHCEIIDNITDGLSAYDQLLPYNLEDILTTTEYKIASLKYQGYNQQDIGIILGFSQSYISRILKSINKKMKQGGL